MQFRRVKFVANVTDLNVSVERRPASTQELSFGRRIGQTNSTKALVGRAERLELGFGGLHGDLTEKDRGRSDISVAFELSND